jgi:alkanesulfonate monooxygenase SsuD/methylene tetrahydromethanopterin reductase-like flavin-dependent oxidoreductase (luciferase family)
VGRIADAWNAPAAEGPAWDRRLDIVRRSAEEAGRDPAAIEVSVTLERALPETDDESARLVDELAARHAAGADHFVMDFGNPASTEPVLRFAEQVIAPLRR